MGMWFKFEAIKLDTETTAVYVIYGFDTIK